jgi:hypothetical protein
MSVVELCNENLEVEDTSVHKKLYLCHQQMTVDSYFYLVQYDFFLIF